MELLFLAILVLIMAVALGSGYPVAFALPGAAILSIGLAAGAGYIFADNPDAYFHSGGPGQWLSAGVTNLRGVYWEVERDTLIAIPLFIFMGIMLQRSKIAEDLLIAMAQLFGPVPGGLGISVVFVGALLAATTGIVGATVVAMGLISLPAMLRNNYSQSLATGTIAASGTLGQIIPPSIVLIILADQLASATDQASTLRKSLHKEATGELSMPSAFDVTSTSAGEMFLGAFVPGLVLVGLYMLYILIFAIVKPSSAPSVPYEGARNAKFWGSVTLILVPPLALIFLVLGSIISGIATVNQAGAIGAAGALIWSGIRALRIENTLNEVMLETAKATSLVFIILLGAAMLTAAFRAFGGEELVRDFLNSLPGGFWSQFIIVMAVIFFLGFFLDFIEIAVVVVPIVAPILLADPGANITAVWLGVMIGLNIQTSFLTPPFGFALFYLRGVGYYPQLVNYLPNRVSFLSETSPPPRNPKLQYCLEDFVSAKLAEDGSVLDAIKAAQGLDLSPLPQSMAGDLSGAFESADTAIASLAEAFEAEDAVQAAADEYRPQQVFVRRLEKEAYRRAADGSYTPAAEFIEMVDANAAFRDLKGELDNLRSVITDQEPEQSEGIVNELSKSFGQVAGADKVKSALSKVRRALKNKSPDKEKALAEYDKALEEYASGEVWRASAEGDLAEGVRTYLAGITSTLGARQQPDLTREQGLFLAKCNSGHRDVSLSF